jgi:hypothetical protein
MAKEIFSPAKTASRTNDNSEPFFSNGKKEEPFFKPAAENKNAFLKSSELTPPQLNVTANPIQRKEHKEGNLPEEIQMKMENSFGTDFSKVKIHTNSKAAEDLNAIAFTQGNDIHFAPKHNPYSSQGQEYLGHELSHVVQQNAGIVHTTHQEQGFNVNSESALENQADSAGKRAAMGQSAELNIRPSISAMSNSSIQKKDAPIQLLRLLPPGASIQEFGITDIEGVISTFSALWNSFNGFGWLNTAFRNHPDLPDLITTVLGSNYFRGASTYVSEWFDDGENDWYNAAVLDNNVRIVMSLYIDNEVPKRTGDGSFSSGGTTTDTRTSAQTVAGNIGGTLSSAPAGSTGGVGGNVTGGASINETTTRSMAVAGTSGLSMNMPAQIKTADIKFKCELKVNPSFLSIRSHEMYSNKVGTLTFGAPA